MFGGGADENGTPQVMQYPHDNCVDKLSEGKGDREGLIYEQDRKRLLTIRRVKHMHAIWTNKQVEVD